MKYTFVLLALLVACTSPNEDSSVASQSTPLGVYADSLFRHHIDSGNIAGGALIVQKGGEVLVNKSYGFASLELKAPMPQNPSFEIGSVTKQFTAAAILKLAEEGKVSLEADVSDYLDLNTGGRIIKVRQLLDHTSGIPSYTEIPEFWQWSVHTYPRDTMLTLIEQNDFLFEPGEALIYNNSAYFLLGLIIEKVSGMTYEEFLKEQFFEPLGMSHTYYCSTRDIVEGKVTGYSQSPDGLIQKGYLDHTWPYAAGSLCSTAGDLLIWMNALHSGKIFNADFYSSLVTPGALNDGTPVRYAMGLAHFSDYGHDLIQHGGGINGFLSDTKYYPEEDLYVICLVNTTGPQGAGFFTEHLTWELLDKKEITGVEMEEGLTAFSGTYSGQVRGRTLKSTLSVTSDGLIISTEGQKEVDTIRTYIGNNTWMDGNDIITLQDDYVAVDQVYGFYKLKREE